MGVRDRKGEQRGISETPPAPATFLAVLQRAGTHNGSSQKHTHLMMGPLFGETGGPRGENLEMAEQFKKPVSAQRCPIGILASVPTSLDRQELLGIGRRSQSNRKDHQQTARKRKMEGIDSAGKKVIQRRVEVVAGRERGSE